MSDSLATLQDLINGVVVTYDNHIKSWMYVYGNEEIVLKSDNEKDAIAEAIDFLKEAESEDQDLLYIDLSTG